MAHIKVAESYTPRDFISKRFSVSIIGNRDHISFPCTDDDYGFGLMTAVNLAERLSKLTGLPVVKPEEQT
jgi:hypothetical protein